MYMYMYISDMGQVDSIDTCTCQTSTQYWYTCMYMPNYNTKVNTHVALMAPNTKITQHNEE